MTYISEGSSKKLRPDDLSQITITKKEYERLLKRDEWLSYLEAAGVDSWDGCDVARELYNENEEND